MNSMQPSVSMMIWRLRPAIFLPASWPQTPPPSVVLTDWLSITPAPGDACLPVRGPPEDGCQKMVARRWLPEDGWSTATARCHANRGNGAAPWRVAENTLAACATDSRWKRSARSHPSHHAGWSSGADCRALQAVVFRRKKLRANHGTEQNPFRPKRQPILRVFSDSEYNKNIQIILQFVTK